MSKDNTTVTIPPESCAAAVECEVLTVPQAGGYEGYARVYEAGVDPYAQGKRAILFLHGIQSHGGWFLRSCDALQRQGHTVLAPDRRGSGLNQLERGHCDKPEQLIRDVDCCVDWLLERTDKALVDLAAVSWSGKLALAYTAAHPEKVRSITLVTPGLCARVDITLKEKISVGVDGLVHPHRLHEIPLNEPQLFTANPAMLRFIERDPLKLTHATASFFITSTRLDMMVRKLVGRIHVPVYLMLAERDRIIDNGKTIELLMPVLRRIPGTSEPALIWPGAEHTLDFEPDPEPYFRQLRALFVS